jgi:hypothetical protein
MSKRVLIGAAALAALALGVVAMGSGERDCFSASLHATGEGMRYWYEEAGGFMDVTGIPYDQLDCSNCHVKSCDQCHAATAEAEGTCALSVEQARKTETCLKCHSRAKLAYEMAEERGTPDVHASAGMVCADCHAADVHGDGQAHTSMRDPGAVKAACTNCHESATSDTRAHTVHQGKLNCTACHVENTVACLNCHMDSFLKTGSRKGNFFPVNDWLLLVNHEDQVTAGTAMTLVHEGRKFVCYTPYFTHVVRPDGRNCADCHNNKASGMARSQEPIRMAKFFDNKLMSWQGVVPLVEGRMEWVYLDKEDGIWMHTSNPDPETVQYVGYGTPLTKQQIKSMSLPMRE